MGFKKIMVYKIPPGWGVNHIWPAYARYYPILSRNVVDETFQVL